MQLQILKIVAPNSKTKDSMKKINSEWATGLNHMIAIVEK